ncbi:YdcF family protein [Tychonema sp. LEGE 07199]|uniref:SanA/YdcF family protein n=1 Tax=Microcoleaceae TaxID=1892252 RepID=UPI0018804CDE|nr:MULTISPECIES: ElyC/SanA/YdcF family protein [unclassified Tychonema]MBE9121726.1 YdcF family protein [Tychonema sp. LEGE 07199]MBE9133854.1 YdcF family protein [Tychonema sp. LEGE 07196]MBE9162417.1 YdcF family protein [Tychonema sp. LEGE 06208]
MVLKSFLLQLRLALPLLILACALTSLALNYYVRLVTSNYRHSDIAKVPAEPIAIVFGAGIWEDGTPTPMLADRVQAAVDLYKTGRVRQILMTGDNSSPDYNEVKAMQEYAQAQGVPLNNITLDYAGLSTYESCYRAKEIFGITQAVLVTQNFHIARAVYTCRQLGVQAIGLGTPDWGKFRQSSMIRYSFREFLAVLKALWEVRVSRPKPTFLGPFEGIK